MTATTAVVDYGSGNLHSAGKALERAAREHDVDSRIFVTSDPSVVAAADRVVLPGVGAFGDCHAGLVAVPGLKEALGKAVLERRRPFLGICVGMQLMATRGLEFGAHDGLGWIPGEVRAIAPRDPQLKIPHMGWNTLTAVGRDMAAARGLSSSTMPEMAAEAPMLVAASSERDDLAAGQGGAHALAAEAKPASHPLFDGIPLGRDGWHAYFVHSFHFVPERREDVVAETDYGGPITAAVARDNLFGTQFHPEKSQALGLRLLGNFLRWSP